MATANAFGTTTGGASANVIRTLVNNNQVQFATVDEGSYYSIQLNSGAAARAISATCSS